MRTEQFENGSPILGQTSSYLKYYSLSQIENPFTNVIKNSLLPQVSFSKTENLTDTTEDMLSSYDYSCNIPVEMDIFSELPDFVFDSSDIEQMAVLMKKFRNEYYRRVIQDETISIKPKLQYNIDEDGVQTIQMISLWKQGKAMMYFSFEKDAAESSFGLIWNDNSKKNYQTRSGNLLLNNIDDIIHEAIDFIYRVYS